MQLDTTSQVELSVLWVCLQICFGITGNIKLEKWKELRFWKILSRSKVVNQKTKRKIEIEGVLCYLTLWSCFAKTDIDICDPRNCLPFSWIHVLNTCFFCNQEITEISSLKIRIDSISIVFLVFFTEYAYNYYYNPVGIKST